VLLAACFFWSFVHGLFFDLEDGDMVKVKISLLKAVETPRVARG
jgi:hypothetical protein